MAVIRIVTTFSSRLTFLLLIGSVGLVNAERFVCYFSSFATQRSGEYKFETADIPVSLCTHVVYDHFEINFFSKNFRPSKLPWQKFSELKRIKPDLKLLLSVLEVADDSTSRKTLIGNIIQYVEWMKVDGVELFWSGGNGQMYFTMVQELQSSFVAAGHPTWEVDVLVPIDKAVVDHARLCRLVDFVHVLGIGERKPRYHDNSSTPTAKTTLDVGKHKNVTLERALEHLIDANCPANKIVLVVILFAQTYTLGNVNTRDRPKELTTFCNLTRGSPYCAYVEICQKFNESEWTLGSDDTERFAPHAIQGNTWVAYENEASIGQKGEIARRKNLAGVYVFSLDLDDYRGKCGKLYPLTTALSSSFRGTTID
ncbi:endochitinase-like [Anopheles maculipalpis]|uniref:endochitinase-like n=1 Tax=Anopheles maculipalpis TaxID=1496333 RepID=UPI002158D4F7|nr:endochitinase-like [Anopheles maculipalpis]